MIKKMIKKSSYLVLAVITAGALSSAARANQFDIDPAHSSIAFEVKHLTVSTVHGNFPDLSGSIDLNDKNVALSKAQFTVKIASVTTANAKRDEHLRSADFFDAAKYPEAKFVSTNVKKVGKEDYLAEGDLTIHGVTKQQKVNFKYLGTVKDPMGTVRAIFSAETELNRKDYGVSYGPDAMVSDKVKVMVYIEATPHAAQASAN
jgi:polyisoprenoid-binding protein YceI